MSQNCNCSNCDCEECVCGTTQDAGEYTCCNCGQRIYLDDNQTLPPCPKCGNQTYTKTA